MGEEETRMDPKCDNKTIATFYCPLFYKPAMYLFCKNARDPNNPAVAGKYFTEDYVLTRSDLPILENNLKMAQDIKTSIQKQEEDAKKHLCTHFSKAGKLLPRHNHPKTFDEKLTGKG